MNVHRLTPGSRAATGAVNADAPDAETRVRAPEAPAPSASAERSDRFELSEAARARQAEAAAREAEVDAARHALHAEGELAPERVAQLRQQIEDGFYDRPEVIDTVAERAAADLRSTER